MTKNNIHIVTEKIVDRLKRLAIVSKILRMLHPNYSYCEKCGLPWSNCESKTVEYSESSGTFATCQFCWEHSTLDQLKNCYTKVYRKQALSILEYNEKMDHSLEHLLNCVERDYFIDRKIDKSHYYRKKKIKKLIES